MSKPSKLPLPFMMSYQNSFPIHATCSAHFVLPEVIVLIFAKEYSLWSSSLCSFLQCIISSLSGSNILVSTLFSDSLNLCSSLNVTDQI
jgi:hypothetical protein